MSTRLARPGSPGPTALAKLLMLLTFALLTPGVAQALPQFAVRAAGRCDALPPAEAAVDPTCAVTCTACHISPTGGGARNAGGFAFQRDALATFGVMDPGQAYTGAELARIWSPAGGTRPADIQVGADVRSGLRAPLADAPRPADATTGADHLQATNRQFDLYLALRPYNPSGHGRGRLTLLATAALTPAIGEAVWDGASRAQVREWWALYDDLPLGGALRVGRFAPAAGWRFGDDAAFTAGPAFAVFGRGLDRQRQVTGAELTLNPGPFYAHLSAFLAADDADDPFDTDAGGGGNLALGWRGRVAQVGATAIVGRRSGTDLGVYHLTWGLDLAGIWPRVPLLYLGEFGFNRSAPEAGVSTLGLAATHELDWFFARGFYARLAYTWRDPSTDFAYDTNHRALAGLQWYPLDFLSLSADWRHDWRSTDDRLSLTGDTFQAEAHFFF